MHVTSMLQVIEISLEFLDAHPNFSFPTRNNFTQPLLPTTNIIKPNYMILAVKIAKAFQKRKYLLLDENFINEEDNYIKENIQKDVLLFKENMIKNASLLTKRNNPYAGINDTTNEYENAFKELSNAGLGKLEKKS